MTRSPIIFWSCLLIFCESSESFDVSQHFLGMSSARRSAQRVPTSFWQLHSESEHSTANEKSLLELLMPSEDVRVNRMSGTDLAYIGDSVFELFVRSRIVWPAKRTSDLQNKVVAIVRAEHQSLLLSQIKSDFPLSEKEMQVVMRGRNAVTRSKNRRNPAAYQDSTAFEALLGYLYITDQVRCQELLSWLEGRVENVVL